MANSWLPPKSNENVLNLYKKTGLIFKVNALKMKKSCTRESMANKDSAENYIEDILAEVSLNPYKMWRLAVAGLFDILILNLGFLKSAGAGAEETCFRRVIMAGLLSKLIKRNVKLNAAVFLVLDCVGLYYRAESWHLKALRTYTYCLCKINYLRFTADNIAWDC